jgi:hypothetical protein
MGKIYNPDDFMCRICAFKSCLYKHRGREIISKAVKKSKEKKQKEKS